MPLKQTHCAPIPAEKVTLSSILKFRANPRGQGRRGKPIFENFRNEADDGVIIRIIENRLNLPFGQQPLDVRYFAQRPSKDLYGWDWR